MERQPGEFVSDSSDEEMYEDQLNILVNKQYNKSRAIKEEYRVNHNSLHKIQIEKKYIIGNYKMLKILWN